MILETVTALLTVLVAVHIYRSLKYQQDFIGDLALAMWKIICGKKETMTWASRKRENYVQNHPAEEAVDTRRFGTPQGRLDSIPTVIGPKKTEGFITREEPASEPSWAAPDEVASDNSVDF